jgi:hypothetical protein
MIRNLRALLLPLCLAAAFSGCAANVEPLVKGNVIAQRAIVQIREDDVAIVNVLLDEYLREAQDHADAIFAYEVGKAAQQAGGTVPQAEVERIKALYDAKMLDTRSRIATKRVELLEMGNLDLVQRLMEAQGRGLQAISATARDIDELLAQLGLIKPVVPKGTP